MLRRAVGRCVAASLRRADTEWAKRAAALQHARPIMRLHLIRRVWAICAACGAEYDNDARAHTFLRVVRNGIPDDEAKPTPRRSDLFSLLRAFQPCFSPARDPSMSVALRRQRSHVRIVSGAPFCDVLRHCTMQRRFGSDTSLARTCEHRSVRYSRESANVVTDLVVL
jgi:hypothetical protein